MLLDLYRCSVFLFFFWKHNGVLSDPTRNRTGSYSSAVNVFIITHTRSEKGHLDRTQVLCHRRYRLCVSRAYASVTLASPCVRPPITFNHLKRLQSRLQQKPSFRLMAQNNDTSGCPMLGPSPIKRTRSHCQHTRRKLQPKAPSRTPLLPCVSLGIPFSHCTSL